MIIDFKDVPKSISNSSEPFLYLGMPKNRSKNKSFIKKMYFAGSSGIYELYTTNDVELEKSEFYFLRYNSNYFIEMFYDIKNDNTTFIENSDKIEKHYCEVFNVESIEQVYDSFNDKALREIFIFTSMIKEISYYSYRVILMCSLKKLDESLNKSDNLEINNFGSEYGYNNNDYYPSLVDHYKRNELGGFISVCNRFYYPNNFRSELIEHLEKNGINKF